MRSKLLVAGLAAAVMSLPLAGAYAAGPDEAGEGDNVPMESGPVSPTEMRLESVLQQLQATQDNFKVDAQTHAIPASQLRQAEEQAANVRREAVREASRNGGKIPLAQYHDLMAQMDDIATSVSD